MESAPGATPEAEIARLRGVIADLEGQLQEIDLGMISEQTPQPIAEAALRPLRDLLGVPRAIVNLFDMEAGRVEWLAAIGRRRFYRVPGIRYPIALAGNLEGLRRGEPQVIDVRSLLAAVDD